MSPKTTEKNGKKADKNACPYSKINIISQMAVWWMNPIFRKGYKEKLEQSNLYPVADYHQSEYLTTQLEKNWTNELERAKRCKRKPSLKRAFAQTYWRTFAMAGIFALLSEIARCLGPIFIGELSRFFSSAEEIPLWYAYVCAAGIAIAAMSFVCLSQLFSLRAQVLGWNARTAVIGLMYKKELCGFEAMLYGSWRWRLPDLFTCFGVMTTLKLSNDALQFTTSGHIVNLSATDALRFDYGFYFTNHLWIAPLECVIVTYVLWNRLGYPAVVGMSVLLMIMLIQTFFGKFFGKLRKEMQKIFIASLMRSFNFTIAHSTTQILSFVTFISFASLQGYITLPTVLIALGLFSVMRVGVGVYFPLGIEKVSELLVAIQRTEEFLLLSEIPKASEVPREKNESSIKLTDFSGSWVKDGKRTLENISLNVEAGKLLMVVGPVGCGKSSLLSAILGELPLSEGKIDVHGRVSYASQVPWIFTDTIRNNILFGENYDAKRYHDVIKACALERDFSLFESGDESLVGERGVTLSGGQRARVGLARMVYCSNSDIALLDDPLSAVDPSVANHLFNDCICGYLKDKVRVLVTHQLQFLEKADQVVVLKEGKVSDCGTYEELKDRGVDFTSFLNADEEEQDDVFSVKTMELSMSLRSLDAVAHDHPVANGKAVEATESDDVTKTSGPEVKFLPSNDNDIEVVDCEKCKMDMVNNNAEERKALTVSGFRIYFEYFKAGVHFSYLIFLLLLIMANHVLLIFVDWWLAHWANSSEEHRRPSQTQNDFEIFTDNFTTSENFTANYSYTTTFFTPSFFNQAYYERWYAVLFVGYLISMYSRTVMHFFLCTRSSIALHTKMLTTILRAKIRFFDTNPVGNVLNRFSKDMGQVDELLPLTFMDVLFLGGSILAVLAFVISVNYFVIIIILPMILYFAWIRRYFVTSSREIKRIEGASRSPVFGHLSSTIQGLAMIRSHKVQETFIHKYHELQDTHSVAWAAFVFGSRWMAVRLDFLAALFLSFCAFLSVMILDVLPDDGFVNPGNLGLTLTYSIALLSTFQWAVRQTAEVENLMTSTERIREYHEIPPESPDNALKKKPSHHWPEEGAIALSNVSFSYYEGGPLVLKNISIDIKAKEKIGIVGRTGAGKSSIIAALFRMSDQISGAITIDGLNTADIPLHNLRSVLAIIPQDPVLFGGTMRKNLDAFSAYTDDQLWNALEQVQLKSVVENLPLKLESEIAESGSNFSVGQRQLVCLARAILRNNRILIIDEATANVDLRTDHLIQETIVEKFSHCTVLTIAHRLNTIINSDRIAVLDNGVLIECDEPHILLEDRNSSLSEMVRMTHDHEQELRRSAKRSYLKRHECDK